MGLRGGASGKGRTGAERAGGGDPCAPGTAAASGGEGPRRVRTIGMGGVGPGGAGEAEKS